MSDMDETMAEPPHAPNHGRKRVHVMTEGAPMVSATPMDAEGLVAEDYLTPIDPSDVPPWGSGVGVVDTSRGTSHGSVYGATDAGMVAHRGALHPGEYVDFFALRAEVEAELGFTYADVSAAYALGRPTAEQRQLREKIDARLLALSREGGNMAQLAKVLDLSEKTVDRALRRARVADVAPMVANAAVVRDRVCFKTGELGATPRRRRFSTSPSQWVGTVDLSDEEYAKGFERRPGNPAYWEHRLSSKIPAEAPRPRKREQRFPADWPSDQAYDEYVRGA